MTLALVFVECGSGLESSAEKAVRRVKGVFETHRISSGAYYDLLLKVEAENENQFKDVISMIKQVAGVAAIAVSIVYGVAQ